MGLANMFAATAMAVVFTNIFQARGIMAEAITDKYSANELL
mgnify:CR=1 FL=1